MDDHSRIFAKARPTSLYNTVYSTSLYLHVTSIEIISILFPGVKIPVSIPESFRRSKGLRMSSILHSFETTPLKIFPPRVISMFLKNKEDEKPRLSYFDMEGDANSAPSSRKFITVSRRSPSPPAPITRSIPLLSNVTKIIPLLRSFPVDVSRNYPLETRYKTGSVAKLRLYYSGPVPELVLLIVTPFLRPSSGR